MPAKEPGFAERLQTAAKAKQAQLEKMRATTQSHESKLPERQAPRVEPAEARKVRTAERKDASRSTTKPAQAKRVAAKATPAQAVEDEKARKEAERVARAQADAKLKQDQKAAREAKYPAHKARRK